MNTTQTVDQTTVHCDICNTEIKWIHAYTVVDPAMGIFYDAMDCPHCGCQVILQERLPEIDLNESDE